MPRSVTPLAFLILLALPSVAAADVCVDIDEARDALPEADRAAARALLERQLIVHGSAIAADAASCTEHWTVSHIELGGTLTVTLDGAGRSQTATVGSVAELGTAYAQMVEYLLAPGHGEAPGTAALADAAEPLPSAVPPPEAPARAPVQQRRGTIFARVGYGVRGAVGGYAGGLHGTTFGVGYRRSTSTFGFEISTLDLMLHRDSNHNELVWDSFVRLAGFLYVGHGAFVGSAFGYGESKVNIDPGGSWVETRTEYGPHLDAFAGAEILSSPTFHVAAIVNLLLPLYSVETFNAAEGEKTWSPGVSASLSVGF